jgi:hypothetical protein
MPALRVEAEVDPRRVVQYSRADLNMFREVYLVL